MRTIESFEEYVDPVQQVIDDMFLPTLFGHTEPLPDELSERVTLTPAQVLSVKIFHQTTCQISK